MSRCDRFSLDGRAARTGAVAAAIATVLAAVPTTSSAKVLDFGAALQDLRAGTKVTRVHADGGTMNVSCRNHGGGPDVCIVFDSSKPTGGDTDLGTPNDDFGGPGDGAGGGEGEPGENRRALGKVLIIAENVTDENGDGRVDVPDDESGGGVVWLRFSHAGRLSMTLVDVDEDEDAPQFCLYRDGDLVASAEGERLGDNSAQTVEFRSCGSVDAVKIVLDGSTSIGRIRLDVPVVAVEPRTWSGMKQLYR